MNQKSGVTLCGKVILAIPFFFWKKVRSGCWAMPNLGESHHISPGLCDFGPGELFGDVCLYAPQERTATVVALTMCV